MQIKLIFGLNIKMNIMRFVILLAALLFVIPKTEVNAQQTLKIGHVNIQELAGKHPAMDSIRTLVQREVKDMQDIYKEMLTEHAEKLKAFEAESAGYTEVMRQTKQTELFELAEKVQNFNKNADLQIQQRNKALIRPIYEQINQEIENVASENKFSYILDVSTGTVAYISPNSEDITPLVLARLK